LHKAAIFNGRFEIMKKTAIVNARVITPNGLIDNGAILIENGIIWDFGIESEMHIPDDVILIDAKGNFAGPGFIDIHCNGGGGFLFEEDPRKVVEAHLLHGVTGILATLAYDLKIEEILEGIQRVKDFCNQDERAVVLGLHLEGPYINCKYGASSYLAKKFNPDEYNMILKAAGGLIKRWTIAPELEGVDEFSETVSGKGILLSVGHSEAEPEMIYRLVSKGLKLACHCTNATGVTPSPPRFRGTKEVGVDEAVLAHDDIFVEVIPDSWGYHVRSIMLNLIYKINGADKVIIISDAVEPSGISPFNYIYIDGKEVVENAEDIIIDKNGDLNGTKLTMDYAVRNMMNHTGIGICDAFKMASLNPAVLLGLQDQLGSVEKGKKANIIIVNEKICVKHVIVQGEIFI
jgi:N-acetylglucosamine-6-phosphate deacetylase